MSPFLKSLPNLITGSRLFFAAGYLILLWCADAARLSEADVNKFDWAFVLFVIAGVTDIIDGPMARSLKVTSSFGRRFDPLVDKILTGGSFIMLALKGQEFTGIAWWMVAVILLREILVSTVRNVSESKGKAFAATWTGKLKMFFQSITIGTIVVCMGHYADVGTDHWAYILRQTCIWVTVIYTALSAILYGPRIKQILVKK